MTRIDPNGRRLLAISGILVVLGLAALSSAYVHSEAVQRGSLSGSLLRQLTWVFLGGFAGYAAIQFSCGRVAALSFPLYFVGVASLAAVLAVGVQRNGATRWFRLGPLSLQPSEFAKLFALLALARFLSWPDRAKTWKGFAAAWALAAVPMMLIQFQPDLTTALLLAPALFAMLWVSGTPVKRWVVFAAGLAVLFCAMWATGAIRPYQKSRVTTFLHKLGVGREARSLEKHGLAQREAYQEIQARIAIGSGRVWGKGFLSGTQNQLSVVPMSSTDFIFAVIGEEWGFLGSIFLLGLYGFLVFHLFRIAQTTGDAFGRLFVVGFSTHFACQVIVNIGMATGMFPVVGIPLPLVSAGGSSVVVTMIGAALVARIGSSGAPSFSRE